MSLRFAPGYIKPTYNPATSVSTYKNNLYTAGYNPYGGTGQNTTFGPSQLYAKIGSSFWISASSSRVGEYALAVREDGTLWSWGRNDNGQLGLGNTTYYSSPKQVGALTTWRSVSGGYGCSYAIKSDGTLWSWGKGTYGALGIGNTTSYSSPKQVGALTDWLTVSAGVYYGLAIKTDGTLWGWGQNSTGQLGDGTTSQRNSPVQIGALTTWSSLGTHGSSYSVKSDGTLWSWGSNYYGQLGLGSSGSYANRSSPAQVGALTTWYKVAAGTNYMLATTTAGTLFSCGEGTYGKLGLGNSTAYSSPKQVSGSSWYLPAAGDGTSFCTKSDGQLWFWGNNGYGEAGAGYNMPRTSNLPTQSGVAKFNAISLGSALAVMLG